MSTGAQSISAKQLIILRYMVQRLQENAPYGWTDIKRMERKVRFTEIDPEHPMQPMNEEIVGNDDGLFPLTGKRAEHEDPLLIVHNGQTSYRISQAGVNIVHRSELQSYDGPIHPVTGETPKRWRVVDKRTKRPLLISTTTVNTSGTSGADDYEGDEEGEFADEPAPAPIPADTRGAAPQHMTDPDDELEEGEPGNHGRDEINDPMERGMSIAPPAPPPARSEPAKRPPQARGPRKAKVPGRE